MSHDVSTTLIHRGLEALDGNDTHTARHMFDDVVHQTPTPVALSCLGYCLAVLERDLVKAFDLCQRALRQEPFNPLHHLNLGRVYLLSGNKCQAISTFRIGLQFGRHPRIIEEIERLGMRRPLLFPGLDRRHPLNKVLGFVFSKLGLRGCLHPSNRFRAYYR